MKYAIRALILFACLVLAALAIACGESPPVEFLSASAEVTHSDEATTVDTKALIAIHGIAVPVGVVTDIVNEGGQKLVCLVFTLADTTRFMSAGLLDNGSEQCRFRHLPLGSAPLRLETPTVGPGQSSAEPAAAPEASNQISEEQEQDQVAEEEQDE